MILFISGISYYQFISPFLEGYLLLHISLTLCFFLPNVNLFVLILYFYVSEVRELNVSLSNGTHIWFSSSFVRQQKFIIQENIYIIGTVKQSCIYEEWMLSFQHKFHLIKVVQNKFFSCALEWWGWLINMGPNYYLNALL